MLYRRWQAGQNQYFRYFLKLSHIITSKQNKLDSLLFNSDSSNYISLLQLVTQCEHVLVSKKRLSIKDACTTI